MNEFSLKLDTGEFPLKKTLTTKGKQMTFNCNIPWQYVDKSSNPSSRKERVELKVKSEFVKGIIFYPHLVQ